MSDLQTLALVLAIISAIAAPLIILTDRVTR